MRLFSKDLNPAQIVVLGFAMAIAIGMALLMLPASHEASGNAPARVALFTATSAICVTGHVIVDTPTYWSTFGQIVIMGLIQIGGFGIMTAASVIFLVAGRKLGLRGRLIAQQETQTSDLSSLRSLLGGIALFTFGAELAVAAVLAARLWWSYDESVGNAAWHGVFHSVSAFNNAGFALYSDNLVGFASDWWISGFIGLAVVVGGLGFPVWLDLRHRWRTPASWRLHTKLTLSVSAFLLVGGSLIFGAMEWTNDKTLGGLSVSGRILSAIFMSVTPRTAGFNTVPIGEMHDESLLVTDMLMFVGGGSASTAGGIKVATFAVLFLIVWGEMRGGSTAEAFGRRIPVNSLRQALSVTFLAINAVVLATLALMILTPYSLSECLFETISAFSTVGLSTGITQGLGAAGQMILVALMYLGRVGPLTLAIALAVRERERRYEFPEERPLVG
jgi:trk system potassium uptake protein